MTAIKLGLIGTGSIAPSHLQAIKWINEHTPVHVEVVAAVNRSLASNRRAEQELAIPRTYAQVEEMMGQETLDGVLVLVRPEFMHELALRLIPYRVAILIEKPPGLNLKEAAEISGLSRYYGTNVMVGFNRRFYSVVNEAKRIVEQSGGLLGMRMDAFERYRSYREQQLFTDQQLESLLTSNTIHCIDLIRYYSGNIKDIHSFANKSRDEPFNHRYSALMISENNVPITFQAYWHSYGNWNYELYMEDSKIQFVNLEEAYYHRRGNEAIRLLPDERDQQVKPGFVAQMEYFLTAVIRAERYNGMMSVDDAVETMALVDSLK